MPSFKPTKALRPGPSSTTQFPPSRYYDLIEEANTGENLLAHIYSHKEQQGNSPYMIHLNIMGFPNVLTVPFWNKHEPYYMPVSYPKIYGERQLLMWFG